MVHSSVVGLVIITLTWLCMGSPYQHVFAYIGPNPRGGPVSLCMNYHPTTLSVGIVPMSNIEPLGQLMDLCTGLGIAGATISFTGTGIAPIPSTVTNAAGKYETSTFPAVSSPGTYTLYAHFAGMWPASRADAQKTFTCMKYSGYPPICFP